MNILFVDQTAKLSGGELALLDIVTPYKDGSKVILFEDGPLRVELEKRQVKVKQSFQIMPFIIFVGVRVFPWQASLHWFV
jgi:hypothetical protein